MKIAWLASWLRSSINSTFEISPVTLLAILVYG
jgi:hypothetical protein